MIGFGLSSHRCEAGVRKKKWLNCQYTNERKPVMSDREIRVYGPNFDTEHLGVDLDKIVHALGGASIVILGEDPVRRAMQARALADTWGLKLMKNPIKADMQHAPEKGLTAAIHCVEPTVAADGFVHNWVLNSAAVGPRIMMIDIPEGTEIASSALEVSAIFVNGDGLEIPSAGISSGTTTPAGVSSIQSPNLCVGYTGIHAYSSLMTAKSRNKESEP